MTTATTAEVIYPRWTASLRPCCCWWASPRQSPPGVTVVLWSRGPSYSMLYASLAVEDQAQVTQALDAATIPLPDGLRVQRHHGSSERLSEARLKLAGQDLSDSDNGFSMMTKDRASVSVSLWKTPATSTPWKPNLRTPSQVCDPWTAHGLHLAVPSQSAFVRDQREGSASVFVQLKPGRRLEQEQVQAIVNLVASSVPDLHSNEVTVIDQLGASADHPPGAAMTLHCAKSASRSCSGWRMTTSSASSPLSRR